MFLRRRGAEILERNRTVEGGEIDLVVAMAGRIVAVEVRCRRRGDPVDEITDAKIARMRRAARQVGASRVDLVGVRLDADGAWVRWIPGVG